ncbi:MAG: restriction endonuclease subunit S [Prevotella sp.]|nr:restriction endonuclease subunit S [Prevotella sp.]
MVEWKEISSLGEYFGGLTGKTKKDFENGNAKFITYMNVFLNPSLDVNTVGMVHINERERQNKVQKGDVLFSGSSETPDEAGMSCVVTDDLEGDYYMNSFCFGLRLNNPEQFNLHYFKHILRSYNIRKAISKTANGVTRFNISKASFGKVQIPIPSLSEQNRIVGILDTFTDSIENLKKQIAQRRKQYVYLIDNAFGGSLSEMKKKAEKGTLHVEPLSAHGTFTRGRRFVRTDVVEEGQPCIHYGDMYTYYGLYANKANTHLPYDFPKKMRYAKKGDVVIVGAGENNEDIAVGLVWLGDEPAAVHDACYIYESDFEAMFLSYFLRSSIYHLQIKSHVVRGKICSISSDGIGKALIPVYTMEKQKEIVSNLLPFESLLNNLEAQLAQRQKQYEYYRNKLLTFE